MLLTCSLAQVDTNRNFVVPSCLIWLMFETCRYRCKLRARVNANAIPSPRVTIVVDGPMRSGAYSAQRLGTQVPNQYFAPAAASSSMYQASSKRPQGKQANA